TGGGEEREKPSGAGKVGAGVDVVGREVVPADPAPELDDEQRGDREQHHTAESPQEHERLDCREREQRDHCGDAHQRNAKLGAPVACLSHKNRNGTSKLSSYPSHARKQELVASTPPMSAIGDGWSTRDLAIPRRAFQTAAATARTARQAQGLSMPRLPASSTLQPRR